MIKKWRNMSAGDRLRVQVLIGCLVLFMYAPMYYFSSDRLSEAKRMLHRRQDRIEKRTSLKGVQIGGVTVKAMENRVADLDQKIKDASAALEKINKRFAPLDATDLQQQLMLELSTTAQRAGVHLVSISRKSFRDREAPTTTTSIDPQTGRPMLELTLKARFPALRHFLEALKDLSFHVAVMNVKMSAPNISGDRSAGKVEIDPSLLQVHLVVSE
ncbi:MAG TPA: hypothetical protein DCM28_15080 [Phycisphaerales bacterium]|nr:hypothetical protein [Phycisphaerales bacterium]|tara:strand:+ start:939 stop:1583 length:645 start_codon:yes stop_codon:yes gene_type:complete